MLFISWLPVHYGNDGAGRELRYVHQFGVEAVEGSNKPSGSAGRRAELAATTCVAVLRSSSNMMFVYVSTQVWSVGFGMSSAPQGCCE